MSQRSFGSDIGNLKVETMTASGDVSLTKHTQPPLKITEQMEKAENGKAVSRLPKPLAIEVYSKIHNSTLAKDDLLDEIEDLIDEKYYVGERLVGSGGKEYTVVSSEKRGGLTMYQMEEENGIKIGHRDLRRRKGLSVDEIKQIAIEDAVFVDDEKVWKVREELLKECPIRETKKFAPIFSSANRKAAAAASRTPATTSTTTISDSDSDTDSDGKEDVDGGDDGPGGTKEKKNGHRTPKRAPRASGGPATTASRRLMEKQKEKEQKAKAALEKKEKEKEEKLRKKEEEKAKKQREKDEKLALKAEKAEKAAAKETTKKNGTMDRFIKKENGSDGGSTNAALFSPSKWGERRVAVGVKKLDDAWKKRDQEAFNEACGWCEKNLSGNQRASIENPTYKFAVQKTVDKTKDRAHMKGMKWVKKAEYKLEMAEKRKDQYSQFEPKIKAWFSEIIEQDDLLVTQDPLDLKDAQRVNCDEELLKCMEISQFFVSMRKILLWNENVTAEQLRDDLHKGLEGFKSSTYKMIANLLETALQEKEHEKAAHCNARLSEFPITEHTISELVRAFFVGNVDMSYKRDCASMQNRAGGPDDEPEEMDSEDVKVEEEEAEPSEPEVKTEPEQEPEPIDMEDSEEEILKQRILTLFANSPGHIYEWAPHSQLEVLCAMKEVVHELPIIKEWFLRDANSEQLTGLKAEAAKITKKIEQFNQQLSDLPTCEITDEMTRHKTRELEKQIKKRQQLEKQLDDLKDELEENRESAARERDDLDRIFRVTSIGSDRHLRKYYWFAYSSDAGIWIQDFGTTSYETWVRTCVAKGFMDIETLHVEDRPEYEDLPILCSSVSTEVWYKLDTEGSIRQLVDSLKKNGKREKMLKKYISNNLEDILASIRRKSSSSTKKPTDSEDVDDSDDVAASEDGVNGTDDVANETEEASSVENGGHPDEQTEEQTAQQVTAQRNSRFTGPFGSLKVTMSELLNDWKQSGITKIVDVPLFETRMDDANTLDEMKRLVIEVATSIPKECLIEKFPYEVAIAKKCWSQLKMPRFCRRVQEASNPSCLHMLLAYFDARIDQKRTLPELPCQVCRKKNGTNRKLMCKQCATVFHYGCHRPTISRQLYEEEGFKEGWWCAKCTKEDRRRQLIEAKEQQQRDHQNDESGGSGSDEDDEMMIEEEEEATMHRGRSAKRKANAAMRDVLEFEGVLRHSPAPPPPAKKHRRNVMPEVQDLYNSIEKSNPRLYKVIYMIPSQSRSTRTSQHESQSLQEIEDNLDVYTSVDRLHLHLTQFFQQARGYIETHNPRKLDELESLISELNFV